MGEFGLPDCPETSDGNHCGHWYDGTDICCACNQAPPDDDEEES